MDRLDELTLFLAILETGSLAAAGRRLRRSAPAVTRSLAALEDRLGVRLVERTTRRLAATEAGRLLAAQARQVLSGYTEAMTAAGADEPLRGALRITAPVVFGRLHVMPVVFAFLRAYPDITIDAVCSDSNVDLIEHEIDVAIRIGPLADSSLVVLPVGDVSRVMVASPAYLAERGTPDSIDGLAGHDIIFNNARPVTPEWRLREDGHERIVRFTPRLEVNQVEASLAAAKAGLGIARGLSYQVVDALADGSLVRLLPDSEPPRLPVQLVTSGTRHRPARTRVFLDFAAEALRRMRHRW